MKKENEKYLNIKIEDPTIYLTENKLGRNLKIKKAGVETLWTPDLIEEYLRCKNDIEYFAKKYVKIVNLDKGLVTIDPFPYQVNMWDKFDQFRFNIVLACRQSGKSIAYVVYVLHKIIFTPDYKIALLANKGSTARKILSRVILALEYLPFFLQPGTKTLNRGSIEFDQNSEIYASSTSKDSIRGDSVNCVSGDTKIKIRNKITKEEKEVTMDEFAILINSNNEKPKKTTLWLHISDD
jgi:hypothetical protein